MVKGIFIMANKEGLRLPLPFFKINIINFSNSKLKGKKDYFFKTREKLFGNLSIFFPIEWFELEKAETWHKITALLIKILFY